MSFNLGKHELKQNIVFLTLSLFRSYFALLAPHRHTEISLHTGLSLHHTLAAEGIKGMDINLHSVLILLSSPAPLAHFHCLQMRYTERGFYVSFILI